MTQPTLSTWLARKREGKKKRPPIPRVSGKRAVQLREYAKKRKAFLEKRPFCEAEWESDCMMRSQDLHHLKGRRGDLLNDERFFLAVCRPCHNAIHRNPSLARKWGLLA